MSITDEHIPYYPCVLGHDLHVFEHDARPVNVADRPI